ncbi:MAG: O-antigen ligase family protein, partial [Candidatus Magasanikbacteria bacterium]|nr:O-antigen ligase family protein [Candidatus Magasanikbacteria bacterium]
PGKTNKTLSGAVKDYWWWISVGAAIFLVAALFFTTNRGSLVGLAIGFFGGLLAVIFSAEKKTKYISGGILLLGVGFVLLVITVKPLQNQFPRLAGLLNASQLTTGTGATRLMAWKIAYQGFKERPSWGWGEGNYTIIFNKYYNPDFLKFDFSETVWDKPHNWWLEIATSAGVLGLASYGAMLIVAGYSVLAKKNSRFSKLTGVVLAGTLLAYAVQLAFLFETINSLLLFGFILAFISSNYFESPDTASNARSSKLSFITYLIFPVLVLALWKFNILPLRSSYFLSAAHGASGASMWSKFVEKGLAVPVTFQAENGIFLAERFIQLDKAGSPVTDPAVVASAVQVAMLLDREANLQTSNPLPLVWSGQIYMVLGEKVDEHYYAQAERDLTMALERAPTKQEILFFLGRLYILKKDFVRALQFQEQAVALAPTIGTSHWFLGLTAVASGDIKRGLGEIEEAIRLNYSLTLDRKLYIIDLYAGDKQYDKVVTWYRELIAEDPENVTWYVKLATTYAVMGKKTEALTTVQQAVTMYPPLQSEADKFIKQYHLR